MKKILFLILLFIPIAMLGQAGKLFTADSQLSSSLINKVYQDANGMIWIATEDGLNRYDGAKFTTYRHEDGNPHSLSHNYVRTIFSDSHGRIFIGTYSGLQMYDIAADCFSEPATWPDGKTYQANVIDMTERHNGEIWISGGLLVTLHIDNNRLTVQTPSIPIPTSLTDYILEDRTGNIWVTRGENCIYRIGPNNQIHHYLEQEKGTPVTDLAEDSQGNIYAACMGKGLYQYNTADDSFQLIPYQGKNNLSIKALFIGKQDEVYICTDGQGVKIYQQGSNTVTDYQFENSFYNLSDSKVHSLLKDNNDNFWMALYQKGVMFLPSQPNGFKYIGSKSSNRNLIGKNCVTALCQDTQNSFWIGTDNGGLYRLSADATRSIHYPTLDKGGTAPATILNLYEDSEGTLWFGSFINGMGQINKQNGVCSYEQNLKDKGGNHIQRVYAFAEDHKKRLWIATMGAGLFYRDLKNGQTFYPEIINTKINSWISCMLYTPDHLLYIGTYDGLSCIDLNNEEMIHTESILNGHIINAVCQDTTGMIWIGTADGLSSWNRINGEVKTYTAKQGLPSNTVYALITDNDGYLWISTNAGIARFHLQNHHFINYYVSDGLQGNEFAKNTSYKDPEGNIWLGGVNGITYFNPKDITSPEQKWTVRITDFLVYDKPVRKGMKSGNHEIIDRPVFEATEFYLSHTDNTFSIEFATREFNNPERINYLYTMNSSHWISLPQGVNRISFSKLQPGNYCFRVKAMDYTLDSDIREIHIYIAPPWWNTWWCHLIYILLALGAILYIVQQVRHRYRTKQEIMQHIHAEEINEAKLQFFINISHEIRTPMSLIISPLHKLITRDKDEERQAIYHLIDRNANRILRLINQLMDLRKIDKGQMSFLFKETNIVEAITDICNSFQQMAEAKHISLRFHHGDQQKLNVWVDPDNFDKIIINILSNAFKFTPEKGKIEVLLSQGEDTQATSTLRHYVEITITDSGIGIDEQEREHIFDRFYQIRNSQNNSNVGTGIGLHLTRSLITMHHGSIRVSNNQDGQPGSCFIVRLPLGCGHLKAEEMATEKESASNAKTAEIDLVEAMETNWEEPKKPRTKYRIMVVEDDEEIRKYVCHELKERYYVQQCTNGKEALKMLFEKAPHLVISDVMMPQMDGFTLCSKIKQNINLNHIPVILLTAKIREEDNIEGLEMGADAYITKPFNIELLKRTVENLIRSHERLRNTFSGQQIQEDKLNKIEIESPDDKLMKRIMKVINDNLSNPELSIDIITAEVGISRTHLHRKLKELTNQTTTQFVRNIRLKQAAILLAEKRHNINEIATLTGFSDSNYFSTSFKEAYGMTPREYIEKHQQA